MRHVPLDPRMKVFMTRIQELYEIEFEGEFVCDVLISFMPRDAMDGEMIEAPFAKARFGKFNVKTS